MNTNQAAPIMLQTVHSIYMTYKALYKMGVEVKQLEEESGKVLEGFMSLFEIPSDVEGGFQIDEAFTLLYKYCFHDEISLDECLEKFYECLNKKSLQVA